MRNLENSRDEKEVGQPSLLDNDGSPLGRLDVPIWLIMTAKQHIATSHSLKPGKVYVFYNVNAIGFDNHH